MESESPTPNNAEIQAQRVRDTRGSSTEESRPNLLDPYRWMWGVRVCKSDDVVSKKLLSRDEGT